jgi:hypothetical protein
MSATDRALFQLFGRTGDLQELEAISTALGLKRIPSHIQRWAKDNRELLTAYAETGFPGQPGYLDEIETLLSSVELPKPIRQQVLGAQAGFQTFIDGCNLMRDLPKGANKKQIREALMDKFHQARATWVQIKAQHAPE